MLTLELDKAELKTVNGHKYYIWPLPPTHANQTNRPTAYVEKKDCTTYAGAGSNNSAILHPDVHTAANTLMAALLEYGTSIDDNSILSAVIQNGWRPDDPGQGAMYLSIIKRTISERKDIFGELTFPADLEETAQGILGDPGDPRRTAFQRSVSASPGWNATLMQQLFYIVDNAYAPRGSNKHTTGFVFDLDFKIYICTENKVKRGEPKTCTDGERSVGADTHFNDNALRSAAGMWINQYSMQFNFDSYNTGKEVWHLEYRKPKK